jgi:RNA polymerase sigma factor (sigma-70 family)
MATGQRGGVIRQLRATLLRDGAGLSDAELLECWVSRHDEAAFRALLRRHGPMVLGVCRRVLCDLHDAEDAFQATFLVLVRKAGAITRRAQLGNWLYGVAYNTARKARAMSRKRRSKEQEAAARPRPSAPEDEQTQARSLLDRELSLLPDKYRVPLVLCELEGTPLKEAARRLGWPQGTVASRLSRGRALLARRLRRHGPALSVLVLTAVLSEAAEATPPRLLTATARAAVRVAAGGAAIPAVSARAAALTERVVQSMLLNKLKRTVGLALLLALGVSVGALQGQPQPPATGPGAKPTAQAPAQPKPKPAPREGRIYYWLDFGFASIQPNGLKAREIGRVAVDDTGYQPHSARLSPDGKRLAYGNAVQRRTADGIGVWPPDRLQVRDVNKASAGEVVAALEGTELHNWVWSPDGTKLAITSWDAEHFVRNWVVDVKTRKVEEVKLPRYKLKDKEYYPSIQAWSPDGAWFLAGGDGLLLVKTDGTAPRQLTRDKKDLMGGSCRFSPDGRKVLFVGCNKDKSQTLYVADVASGKVRAVVEAKNFSGLHACWSPDGRRIAYCTTLLDADGRRAGETSIFVTDLEGKTTTTVRTERHEPNTVKLRLMGWR